MRNMNNIFESYYITKRSLKLIPVKHERNVYKTFKEEEEAITSEFFIPIIKKRLDKCFPPFYLNNNQLQNCTLRDCCFK